ncbi:efflux RND transporter periplasmic adaptor subunit [Marinobacter sp. 2_MG-2023]|uniref:efflux RND transporter periplasmic adaptor subunit n=1 Tax=Marinobacter sp. 2_MG-2023 TaxID=3062679 RepID=UPI0026E21AB6|nr:efflux RND transporter periplasmic adaptor subunit [Marinobacter sp. 2_MG-2023]MDO6440958.1 efflux RND transporter periplasmic adaptor subunit [Marinobacter sp. 2_MG-2023]
MSKVKWSSLGLSLVVVIVLVIWMATGDIKVASTKAPEKQETEQQELTRVQVTTLNTRLYEPGLLLQGELEPWSTVNVSARAAGTVQSIGADLGESVKAGDLLLTLSEDGRGAVVQRWQARVKKLEADLTAARKLRSSNLASQSEILSIESDLAAARAELQTAELEVAHLRPSAPFDGVINSKSVEAGSLVQVGSPLLELVRIDRLKAKGQVPQQSVSQVAPGQKVRVRPLDGDTLDGVVSFVASAANPETRSFALEIAVDNPDKKRIAGGSANLRVALPDVQATFISPAYLSLGDDGRPGVKYVDEQNQVVFRTVKLLNVSTEGAWVTGLPDEIRLITRGGGFVSEGEYVEPVDASDERG